MDGTNVKTMVGSSSVNVSIAVSNLPSHNHNILFSHSTTADGGIWGSSNVDGGNFGGGGGYFGTSGYAYTAYTGSGNAINVPLPV